MDARLFARDNSPSMDLSFAAIVQKPSRRLRVAVVDDSPEAVRGMVAFLQEWPGLEVTFVRQTEGLPDVDPDMDIVLLDENMGDVSGTEVYAALRGAGSKATIASTTTGHAPAFTRHHFGRKAVVPRDPGATRALVDFMNLLILEHGA